MHAGVNVSLSGAAAAADNATRNRRGESVTAKGSVAWALHGLRGTSGRRLTDRRHRGSHRRRKVARRLLETPRGGAADPSHSLRRRLAAAPSARAARGALPGSPCATAERGGRLAGVTCHAPSGRLRWWQHRAITSPPAYGCCWPGLDHLPTCMRRGPHGRRRIHRHGGSPTKRSGRCSLGWRGASSTSATHGPGGKRGPRLQRCASRPPNRALLTVWAQPSPGSPLRHSRDRFLNTAPR
eukprot:scaffold1186_cov399-Prasinococcus_capsulatus_cf.AAC.13